MFFGQYTTNMKYNNNKVSLFVHHRVCFSNALWFEEIISFEIAKHDLIMDGSLDQNMYILNLE